MRKKKFNLLALLALAIILVLGPTAILRQIKKTTAAWFNDSWGFRKAITFNNSGAAVTNQKVKVDVNTATLIDPLTVNFNTADLTFTPNMAKRNAGTGTSAPFAFGVTIQGDGANTSGLIDDVVSFPNGTQINSNFYSNFDTNQGAVSLWWEPEYSSNSLAGSTLHYLWYLSSNYYLAYDYSNDRFELKIGGQTVTSASNITAGASYSLVANWTTQNVLSGSNYICFTINNGTPTCGTNQPTPEAPASTIYVGTNGTNGASSGIIEGLIVYRRPLWDGVNGINVGNGDEIANMVGIGATEPSLIIGSWDVVFALPTNSVTGILGVGGTDSGQAWSHPYSSNVLYTSTTNTGGFMMNGTYTDDGWENEGTPLSMEALADSEKIYSGGYKWTNDAANEGIGRTASVGIGSTGQNYVIRAIANSDGTSIPKIQIWDNTNNAEITSLTGTVGSGRTGPDVFVLTFELPTTARNGVAASCTSFDVRLLNTQSSGTVYWHQVELLPNLVDNPSLETGTGDPWIPSGWTKSSGIGTTEAFQDTSDFHSGVSGLRFTAPNSNWDTFSYTIGSFSAKNFLSYGGWTKKTGGSGCSLYEAVSPWSRYLFPSGGTWVFGKRIIPTTGTSTSYQMYCYSQFGAYTIRVDDVYAFRSSNVSLTVTPASLTNSIESTGVRIDGRDSGTAPMTNLTTTAGTIKFNYTPRHSAADSNKFTESGTVTDDIYLGEWYGDSDDYIRLWWDSANTLALKYSMAGVGASATYNATGGITAGTTYSINIGYSGGGNMTLGIGNTSAITLSSIPAVFGTVPSTAYWGTNSSGTGQADATFAQTPITGLKMKSNCDDIRFTDINGTLLDYYYDSTNGVCNAESTDFYVLMPSINAGNNTIYMYYGSNTATKGSKTSNFSQATFSQSTTTFASEEKSKAPVAYWNLDEGQGNIINDSGQARMTGTLGTGTSAPTWQTEDMCISGKCLYFNGNDFVSIGSTARDVQTISLWVKPTTTSQNFIDLDNGTHYISDTSGIVSATGFGTPTIYVNGRSNGTLTANQWNHIEVTTATSFDASNIKLGRRTTNYLTGFLDEVKIFNYARSVAEIKADFNSRGNPEGVAAGARSKSAQIGSTPDPLANGLVGYWKMDEASWNGTANEVVDSSGNGNHGVGVGDTKPTTGAGKYGNGGVFYGETGSGTGTGVNLGSSTSLKPTSQISVSAWINLSSCASWNTILGNDGSYTYNYWFNIKNNCQVSVGLQNVIAYTSFTTANNAVTTGQWQHVLFTYDSTISKNNANIYVNGQVVKTLSLSGAIGYSGTNTYIGSNSTNLYHFNGSIDEVRIYNRALSPAEVRNLYNWAPGPVAYYNFNEGVGNSAYDTSGNGYNGVWSGTARWTTGKYGKASQFNGNTADYISTSVSTTNNWTVEFWGNISSRPGTIHYPVGLVSGTHAGIYMDFSGNNWGFNDGTDSVLQGSSAILLNNFYHFTVTKLGTEYTLYVNGIKDGSGTRNSINITNLNIGRRPDGIWPFPGKIDDLRVYNYVRTPKQIVEDMNAGHPAVSAGGKNTVGFWRFDEGSGSKANDSSPQKNDGVIANCTWTNDGKFGKALSFDGSSAVNVSVANSISSQSVSLWAKPKMAMTIPFDAVSSRTQWDQVGTVAFNHTIGAGSNRLLLVQVYIWDGNGGSSLAVDSVSYNGVGLSKVGSVGVGTTDIVEVWQQKEASLPTSGTYSVSVTTSGPSSSNDIAEYSAVSLFNVDQTTPVGTIATNTGNDTSPTVNVTTTAGQVVIDAVESSNGSLAVSDQTSRFIDSSGYVGTSAKQATSTSTAMTWSHSISPWSIIGIPLNPADASLPSLSQPLFTLASGINASITNGLITTNGYLSPTVYVNGKPNGPVSADAWNHIFISDTAPVTANTINFGKITTSHFEGLMDEIKIYNYGLTKDEILTDYNQGNALQLGSTSIGSSNTAPSGSAGQKYCVPGDSSSCLPPDGEWLFNEGVGSSAYDSSGNGYGYKFTDSNNLPIDFVWATGKHNKAVRFTGNNQTVNNSGLNISVTNNHTFEFWAKPQQTINVVSESITSSGIVGNAVIAPNNSALGFGIFVGTNGVNVGLTGGGGCSQCSPLVYYSPINGWTHVAVVVTNKVPNLYLNGIFVRKGLAAPIDLYYAHYQWGGDSSQGLYKGYLDDGRIYNYARTPAQIAWDFNSGKPIALYSFNECQGTTLKSWNESYNPSLDLTLNIGATLPQTTAGTCAIGSTASSWSNGATGKNGASLNLDGQDDYAVSSNVALLAGAGQSAPGISWGSWIKPSTAVASKTIINKNSEFKLTTDANSNANCSIYANGGWKTAAVSSSAIPLSSWTHVLCVYDGTNTIVYINGLSSGTQATTGSILSLSTTPLNIGRDPTATQYFNGTIDEVKIWNYPLTAVQVKTEYNSGGIRFN